MIGKDIETAKQLLQAGKLVGLPTETVYGLAGNAFNEASVASIFEAKGRPRFDPLILHTSNIARLQTLVSELPTKAVDLASQFWPGPLTLVLPRAPHISDLVTSGLNTVAVRIPAHPMAKALLEILDFPLAAPSANPFGYISPTTAQHVAKQLGDKIAYILDGGPCQVGIESTIIGFEGDTVNILRKGGIPIEAIEAVVGKVHVFAHSSSRPQAPGMLHRHYSPKVPMMIGALPALIAAHKDADFRVISFKRAYLPENDARQTILSPSGSYAEAAQKLFATLRALDEEKPSLILAEWLPEEGLGVAINDRLKRAAAQEH
jgi:L-threonylcarbamoyladenylate synthase